MPPRSRAMTAPSLSPASDAYLARAAAGRPIVRGVSGALGVMPSGRINVYAPNANYTFQQDDCGMWFANTGASGALVATVPSGLAVGTWFGLFVTATAAVSLKAQFQGSDVCRVSTIGQTSAGGALTWGDSSVARGTRMLIEKVDSLVWFASIVGATPSAA